MYWLIILTVLLVLAFLVWASADIGSNIYLKSVCKIKTDEKRVALTFDDGPDEKMTPKVLDILKEYDVKATFFLVGKNVEKYPKIVQRIVSDGHVIANHTYSHSGRFPLSCSSTVADELQKCNDAIAIATGLKPRLFRPPFGVTNPIIGKTADSMHFLTIGWSIRSLDTVGRRSRESVSGTVIKKLHKGAVILLHDRCKDADLLLRSLIPSILGKGYHFTTIDCLIKNNAYEN